jgi:hypothetical protein
MVSSPCPAARESASSGSTIVTLGAAASNIWRQTWKSPAVA